MDSYTLTTCLRLWLDQQGVNTSKIKDEDISGEAEKYSLNTGIPSPNPWQANCA